MHAVEGEAKPPIADLEIVATWDEIELEAAMGRSAVARALEALEPSLHGAVAEPVLAASVQPFAIPKFLATECPSLEPGHPDRLIPFSTAGAACALVGTVLLIYFGTSPEFGVAARTILGASELADTRAPLPDIPSVAERQTFGAGPLAYSATSEPMRSYRLPIVRSDYFEYAVPPITAQAEPLPLQVVPQSHAEETAALLATMINRGDAPPRTAAPYTLTGHSDGPERVTVPRRARQRCSVTGKH
jgi:hypothetical protein